jgi:hypothetical protein
VTAPNEPEAAAPPEPGAPSQEAGAPSETRTRIIRRAPSGPIPIAPESPTTHIPQQPPSYRAPSDATQRALVSHQPVNESGDRTDVAACAVSIVSGWATSVVATDLIAGWWRTDRLFCVAVAFLALVFAITTVTGVIMLLRRRPLGRYLIAAGAVVAVLTYGGVFLAGARVAWIVYTLWTLPVASVLLAFLPQIKGRLQR